VDLAVRPDGFEHGIIVNLPVDGHRHSALEFFGQAGKARFKSRQQSAYIPPFDFVLQLAAGAGRQSLG
jgi:hypothetical protein